MVLMKKTACFNVYQSIRQVLRTRDSLAVLTWFVRSKPVVDSSWSMGGSGFLAISDGVRAHPKGFYQSDRVLNWTVSCRSAIW